ncbi:MAG TPA: SDR family oxidoreductase [Solimonas sp.]|nr:SDR family oxidoreductase [Solimonas sp.]
MSARTVLITGCSTGIGRALALEFHRRGHRVWATARKLSTLEPLREQGISVAELDVDSAGSIAALAAQLQAAGIAIDMLVNNAGYGAMGPLVELPVEEIRQQFETNVVGLMAVTQAFAPGMMQRRRGRIVNIGSVSGILVTPFAGAYCASKAAVHALSDALRMELAPFGVEVITVQPGAIESQFGATASQGVDTRKGQTSAYAAIADAIDARAGASQDHATPVVKFARQVVDAVTGSSPAAVVRIGNGSTALPALRRLVPLGWLDRVLGQRFRLDQLNR